MSDDTRQAEISPVGDQPVVTREGRFLVVGKAPLENPELTAKAKLIYVALCYFANNDTRDSWPTKETLGELSSLSSKTVFRAIKELEDAGLVDVIHRKHGTIQLSNHYRITAKEFAPRVSQSPAVSVSHSPPGGSESPTNYTQGTTQTQVTQAFPKPSRKEGLPFGVDFESWWNVYPRKKEKKRAHRKYVARRREGVTSIDLLNAALNYRQATRRTEQDFIKHAATFLGPDDHWREYVNGVPEENKEPDLEGVVN